MPPNAVSDRLLDIDGADLVEHQPGLFAADGDLRPKDVRVSAGGRGRDDRRGQVQIVGLKNYRVAATLLLVPDGVTPCVELVDVTTH